MRRGIPLSLMANSESALTAINLASWLAGEVETASGASTPKGSCLGRAPPQTFAAPDSLIFDGSYHSLSLVLLVLFILLLIHFPRHRDIPFLVARYVRYYVWVALLGS
jgi:hypothetical protein